MSGSEQGQADEWLRLLWLKFGSDSDLATAIGAAAVLDELLRRLLDGFLLPAVGRKTIVAGAIQTFSNRIDAARQMGLVSDPCSRDLHAVRAIRNKFAHSFEYLDFSAEEVREGVSEMWLRQTHRLRDGTPVTDPREQFLHCAGAIAYELAHKASAPPRLSPSPPEFFYFDFGSLDPDVRELLEVLAHNRKHPEAPRKFSERCIEFVRKHLEKDS